MYGDDLKTLEAKGDEIVSVMRKSGRGGSGIVPRDRAAEFEHCGGSASRRRAIGINVADVQDAVETAVGGKAVTQVLQGEQRYDLVVRYQPPYRDTKEAIENIRLVSPTGERVSLAQLCEDRSAATALRRSIAKANSRYVAIKYSVRGRDLGSTVEEAIRKVEQAGEAAGRLSPRIGPASMRVRNGRSGGLLIVLPITMLVIFVILYSMFGSSKWAMLILANVAMAPIGGLLALLAHRDALQCVFGRRISGAVRRIGADRRDHAGVHQSIARARALDRGCGRGRCGIAAAADHDDHAGGDAGLVARGIVSRHWFGFAAAVCHRDRGWPGWCAVLEHFSVADALCVGSARWR